MSNRVGVFRASKVYTFELCLNKVYGEKQVLRGFDRSYIRTPASNRYETISATGTWCSRRRRLSRRRLFHSFHRLYLFVSRATIHETHHVNDFIH